MRCVCMHGRAWDPGVVARGPHVTFVFFEFFDIRRICLYMRGLGSVYSHAGTHQFQECGKESLKRPSYREKSEAASKVFPRDIQQVHGIVHLLCHRSDREGSCAFQKNTLKPVGYSFFLFYFSLLLLLLVLLQVVCELYNNHSHPGYNPHSPSS
ncbi:LANO_0F15412g1_1 [Lachancea nothofagi CBS 11611]|uniref:LANO_0F15412g1_1 n=1 Tax=Lachancea nothofagi CBS 11611 TaxID=1266666 RepID=A0A1G4KCP4_9SACH|nr:LANO_0F15412g1_1 [Lachancea nothofagi CBS 11611]